ncbi:hypothetical protein Scep_027591 [Stephania cephalantha]|uniref:Uncharacterized protein n=1 Tax=Stephania cephalantha TaxID=152367 RepID=A0AAP0EGN6_9MAGN
MARRPEGRQRRAAAGRGGSSAAGWTAEQAAPARDRRRRCVAAVARRWCLRRRGDNGGAVNDAMALLDRSLLDEGCESTNVEDAMETLLVGARGFWGDFIGLPAVENLLVRAILIFCFTFGKWETG